MILMIGRELQEKSFRVMGLEAFIGRFPVRHRGEGIIETGRRSWRPWTGSIATPGPGGVAAALRPRGAPSPRDQHACRGGGASPGGGQRVHRRARPSDEGRIRSSGFPVKFHKTPGRLGIAPKLGQHTDQVLAELGGYTAEEIAALRQEGVI